MRSKFLKDYDEAMPKILDIYENLKLECNESFQANGEKHWEYARDGHSSRWVEVDPKTGEASALVSNPGLSFKLSRNAGSADYTVTRIADSSPRALKSYVASIEARTLPAFAPFRAYLEKPINEFLKEKNCTIHSIAWEGQSPSRLIRVDWEITPSKPKGKTRYGKFEILPDAGWVLKSYAIYFKDGYKDQATGQTFDLGRGGDLEYQGDEDGIPLIKRATTWTSAVNKVAGPTFEVTKIVAGPVPKEEFTLASFDVVTKPVASRTPVMYPLLALSAACGVGVLLLRYLRDRASRASGRASA